MTKKAKFKFNTKEQEEENISKIKALKQLMRSRELFLLYAEMGDPDPENHNIQKITLRFSYPKEKTRAVRRTNAQLKRFYQKLFKNESTFVHSFEIKDAGTDNESVKVTVFKAYGNPVEKDNETTFV